MVKIKEIQSHQHSAQLIPADGTPFAGYIFVS